MKKYQLIGRDIENSLSPYIHNYIFKKYNMDAEYSLRKIGSEKSILDVVNDVKNKKINGINITNPYKKSIMKYIECYDKYCLKIGSSNCISYDDDKIIGHNTDWFGFKKMIEKNNINIKDKEIHIIGNGGASKAVYYAFKILSSSNVSIYSRTDYDYRVNKFINVNNLLDNIDSENSIIINATPYNFIQHDLTLAKEILLSNALWIDLLYTKLSTKIYSELLEKKSYYNGLDMLLFQAIESINIWFQNDIFNIVNFSKLRKHINGVIIA